MRTGVIVAVMVMMPGGSGLAAPDALPPLTDAILTDSLELGQELEGRADGDLNGDGDMDAAYAVGSPDARSVQVLLAARGAKPPYRPVGTMTLTPDSLGPATLEMTKGVLSVEDLTGGTALSATYRYRFDPAAGRMRLIGLDATLYSRTYAHDGYEMSWNLLTGRLIAHDLRLNGGSAGAAYDRVFERRFAWPSAAVYMEDTPDAEAVMVRVRRQK